VYHWELDSPAQAELEALDQAARAALVTFMDAAVIVDPAAAFVADLRSHRAGSLAQRLKPAALVLP
jgi:hypothetical protein